MARAVPDADFSLPRDRRAVIILAVATSLGIALAGWWTAPLFAAIHGWRSGRRAWKGAAIAVPTGWAGWLVVRSFFEPVAMVAGIASSLTGLPLSLFLFLVLAFGSATGACAAWMAGVPGEAWARRRGSAGGGVG